MLLNWSIVSSRQWQTGRPTVHPPRARRGRRDGRSWTGPAMSVTSMLGQIRVAKDFCSFGRKTLGLLAWEAEFRSSCASVGHTRLSCNCCVAPALGSTQPNKPRLRPGDPASRLMVGFFGNSTAKSEIAQHSGYRPKNLPPYGRLLADSQLSIRSQSESFDGAGRHTEFNGVRSVTPSHYLPPASAGRRWLCETTLTRRASEWSGPFDARCSVDYFLPVSLTLYV